MYNVVEETPVNACYAVKCNTCEKTTWAVSTDFLILFSFFTPGQGCGKHVESVSIFAYVFFFWGGDEINGVEIALVECSPFYVKGCQLGSCHVPRTIHFPPFSIERLTEDGGYRSWQRSKKRIVVCVPV